MKHVFYALMLLISATVAASACPDKHMYGEEVDVSGKSLYNARAFAVQAGGSSRISDCGKIRLASDRGDGFVSKQPDFSFNMQGMDRYRLVIDVDSECDSVLLINTASEAWFYDDDDGGNLDARIELSRPANGWLDVWVGTHDGDFCQATLSLESFDR